MSDYTREQFADEVRVNRLNSLIRWTLIGCLFALFMLLNIGLIFRYDIVSALIPIGIMLGITLTANSLKNDSPYNTTAGFFVVGAFVAIAAGLWVSSAEAALIVPFILPVLVFIVGTLFPPTQAFVAAFLAAAIIMLVPVLRQTGLVLGWMNASAILLSFVAAGIAALVTADLYQIAEWATFNYARERRVAGELFENRAELERSLARTRALGDRLQETNLALDGARAAAEEAKHFRGQFLANMSHELRTPLNAIIGFSETMLKFPAMYDGIKLPQTYEVDLNQIYTSGQELLKLINDILDLSKVDAGKLDVRISAFDLPPLIAHVTRTANGLVSQKPVKIINEVPDDLPHVIADDSRVRQVLFNLYSNAAKFTEEGTITVRAKVFPETVEVSMTDTGSGIPPQFHELIFEEFKQAETEGRDPRSGAGLGLAISRQLLRLMDGEIWVESEPGKGSTFTFRLPRASVFEMVPAMSERMLENS